MRSFRSMLLAGACALVALAGTVHAPSAASAHDAARQVDGQPATFYWAVLVGIADYAGDKHDLTGAARDAYALRDHLKSLGWRDDHIYVVTDRAATRDGILKGIRWLASKTNNRSAAVFHFSGHEQPFRTSADGDNEARDVAMRTYEHDFILDGDLGRELGRVKAARMWIDMALCRAGGFDDAGTTGPGRVITYSSPENELSYEDTGLRHSVFTYHSIVAGMRDRHADRNHDGLVSVEEAFVYARPQVVGHTSNRQHPTMWDGLSGDFSITPPPAPAPAPKPDPDPSPSPAPTCVVPGVCVPPLPELP